MKFIHLIIVTVLAAPQVALAINKCVTPGGEFVFTDSDCPIGSSKAGQIQYKAPPSSGLRQGEIDALNRIEAREAERRADKRYERTHDARYHVGYSDQLKIRELEMEKSALNKSLTRGTKSYGQTSAIRSQIIGIGRQIEQLRAPKW